MYLSREEVRAIDHRALHEFGMAESVLLENAGRGAAQLLQSLGIRGPVIICCGKGNNGGDGLVMARHLALARATVRVQVFYDPNTLPSGQLVNLRQLGQVGVPLSVFPPDGLELERVARQLGSAEWIVDALTGTGLNGPIRPPLDSVIGILNAAPAPVLALDLPSGLDCDTGEPLGACVRAAHTVTFASLKKGFANPAARVYLGRVHLVGIGVPALHQ